MSIIFFGHVKFLSFFKACFDMRFIFQEFPNKENLYSYLDQLRASCKDPENHHLLETVKAALPEHLFKDIGLS